MDYNISFLGTWPPGVFFLGGGKGSEMLLLSGGKLNAILGLATSSFLACCSLFLLHCFSLACSLSQWTGTLPVSRCCGTSSQRMRSLASMETASLGRTMNCASAALVKGEGPGYWGRWAS